MTEALLQAHYKRVLIQVVATGQAAELVLTRDGDRDSTSTPIQPGGVTYVTSGRLVVRALLCERGTSTEVIGRFGFGNWRLIVSESAIVLVARRSRLVPLPWFSVQ